MHSRLWVAKDANNFTDALAEKAIELVVNNLPICVTDGKNERARAAMHELLVWLALHLIKQD